jgi:nucleoside-diphosphate-sugar epimerase
MRILVTGAGQIGSTLAERSAAQGIEAVVLRRADRPVPGAARTVVADAADPSAVEREVAGADAVVHCVHTGYDPVTWRRALPGPERTVMDAAARHGVPVVFPESVYAFGDAAQDLTEGAAPQPTTPLGQVRAELLAARRDHPARTVSVVAGDLIGRHATAAGSVPTATVLGPVASGRPALVLGDPDAPHSLTLLEDLADALLFTARNVEALAPSGDAIVHAPSPPPITLRRLADLAASQAGERAARVRALPFWPLALGGLASPAVRSLHAQRHLWTRPMILRPGALTTRWGLEPTPWEDVDLLAGRVS